MPNPAPSPPAAAPCLPGQSTAGGTGGPEAAPWHPPHGNPADPRYWRLVDAAFEQLLSDEVARDPYPWLLLQTIASGIPRRALYTALRARPGSRVLDAGTGFGPVAVELAGALGCRVVGLDSDREQLERAAVVTGALEGEGWLLPSSPGLDRTPATVSLAAGVVGTLPFGDATFDAAVARFLLQHVPDAQEAASELARVTKPGGVVCIIDVDDGLSLNHPGPPEPVRRLEAAFQQAQLERGGDRTIGRKLAGLLDLAGVSVAHVLALPQAAYGATSPADWSQRLLHARLSAATSELVDRGLLDEEAATEGLRLLSTGEMPASTVVDVHLAVVGRRRA